MGCELRVFEASNKIKACLMTAKGMIGVVLQVYSSDGAGSPSMVEVSIKMPRILSPPASSGGISHESLLQQYRYLKETCI